MHVARLKNGMPSVHPFRGPELRALRRLQREEASAAYVFVNERKAPLTPDAVRKIVARAGREASLEFPIHPHMLRRATGYKLANHGHDTRAIQQYLGHRTIQHTTRYTDLAPNRFKDFGRIDQSDQTGAVLDPAGRGNVLISRKLVHFRGLGLQSPVGVPALFPVAPSARDARGGMAVTHMTVG